MVRDPLGALDSPANVAAQVFVVRLREKENRGVIVESLQHHHAFLMGVQTFVRRQGSFVGRAIQYQCGHFFFCYLHAVYKIFHSARRRAKTACDGNDDGDEDNECQER